MHIMVDLETMGNESNAAIVSIGAVRFDSKGLYREFEMVADLTSCIKRGLSISGDTVYWWLKQSKEAREALGDGYGKDILHAVGQFKGFVENTPNFQGIWGNGATFDNVILSNAFKACYLEVPWPFWSDKCYRTMKAMLPDPGLPPIDKSKAHNALEDAKYQAKYLMAICKKAGIKL